MSIWSTCVAVVVATYMAVTRFLRYRSVHTECDRAEELQDVVSDLVFSGVPESYDVAYRVFSRMMRSLAPSWPGLALIAFVLAGVKLRRVFYVDNIADQVLLVDLFKYACASSERRAARQAAD